jgi:hypothetical protein
MRARVRDFVAAAAVLAPLTFLAPVEDVSGQTLEVSQTFVDVPTPDVAAYDAGRSTSVAFTLSVTACASLAGCDVTLENPNAASAVPIDVEWRLLDVTQVGDGDAGCGVSAPLLSWQPLAASPAPIFETGTVDGNLACVASFETRAAGLAWSVHQYTAPSTTYWRELTFRVSER